MRLRTDLPRAVLSAEFVDVDTRWDGAREGYTLDVCGLTISYEASDANALADYFRACANAIARVPVPRDPQ